MSRSKQNYDKLVKKDGNYVLNFDQLGRITTAIAPEVLTDGPEGPQGEQGPQGEKGEQGVKGDTTSAYHPKDAVANVAALPTEDNEAGDVRMTIDTQEFHVWGGSSWTNAGSIVPVKGDVGPVGPKGEQGFAGLQVPRVSKATEASLARKVKSVLKVPRVKLVRKVRKVRKVPT